LHHTLIFFYYILTLTSVSQYMSQDWWDRGCTADAGFKALTTGTPKVQP